MFRIIKLNMAGDGLSRLNRELDRIADKHDIEEPIKSMTSLEDIFGDSPIEEDDDEFE